jgi:hypothetical protein
VHRRVHRSRASVGRVDIGARLPAVLCCAARWVRAVRVLAGPERNHGTAAIGHGLAFPVLRMGWHTLQVRDVSPPNSGSTASAIHLCIRNFVGGCGPLGEHSHPVMALDTECCQTSFVYFFTWLNHMIGQHLRSTADAAPPCRRGMAQ